MAADTKSEIYRKTPTRAVLSTLQQWLTRKSLHTTSCFVHNKYVYKNAVLIPQYQTVSKRTSS